MKNKYFVALAAFASSMMGMAQTSGSTTQNVIDFETENSGYTALGVYDLWEDSPFRTNKLEGIVQRVANPFKETDALAGETNTSDYVLGFQRSRYASNAFGVRVTLSTPIALSQTPQYVHVKIHKPKTGRVMLFALGKRSSDTSKEPTIVQVEASSITTVKTGKWYDAVFSLTGADGAMVYSLVIAPEVEPTHYATEDYIAYVDDIEINSSAIARFDYSVYPVSFGKTETLSRSDRYTSTVSLNSADGNQSIAVNQKTDKLVYQNYLTSQLTAKAGETVTPGINFTGNAMHRYVYLDVNNDGKFDCSLNDDGTPAKGSDVMSYSYYKNKNSKGETVQSSNTALSAFTIPSSLTPGFYRLRYKVDWDYVDAQGNPNSSNLIKNNGGVVVDTRLNVHGETVKLLTKGGNSEGTNGEVLASNGEIANNQAVLFGKAYEIGFKPGDGFKLSKFIIRHGYNLEAESAYTNETLQYSEETVPAYEVQNNKYTIPAEWVDGDIRIYPYYTPVSAKGNYALNFDKDLAIDRTGKDARELSDVSFTTTSITTKQVVKVVDKTKVYQDCTSKKVYVRPGDNVNTNINYTVPNWMHAYLYVDLDNDGAFDTTLNENGTPSVTGEMLSFYYNNGKNSKGQSVNINGTGFAATNSVPQFTMPKNLPEGTYRARVKIDWDDVDPAGHWSVNGTNKINENGGYVVDFCFEVTNKELPHSKLAVETENGSLVGVGNTGLPDSIMSGFEYQVLAVGPDANWVANGITVRHGKNLNGEATANGETQWTETKLAKTSDNIYIIPADCVEGDVMLKASFINNNSEYKLIFNDEFNGADNSQPDAKYWSRSGWASPTWKRFTAQTEAGQKETGWIEDGKLVLRCLKNTHNDEVRGDDNTKLQMISGAIESSGKISFTYGKVEARIKNTGHTGNFPAFWMMPQNAEYGGWPYSGEIDIWESIDAQNTSWHTIHSKWANGTSDGSECKGQGNNPTKSGTSSTVLGEYHIYGMEWTPELIKWFVDGKQVFSYARSKNSSDIEQGQWPFNKPFYLILNQSVGNGGWAHNPDENFVYETKFDWVRVYQKDSYVEPTTEKVVGPAMSTTTGTQYGYYLKNVKYNSYFKNVGGMFGMTSDASNADKVALIKTDNGFTINLVGENDTYTTSKLQAKGPAKGWITAANGNATYNFSIEPVDGKDAAFALLAIGQTGRDIKAPAAENANGNGYYGTYSASDNAYQWEFVPANDAATAAENLAVKVEEGDQNHGNLISFSAEYPVAVPEGYEVFTGALSGNVLTLTAINSTVIPANTGVILKGAVAESIAMKPSLTSGTETSDLLATASGSATAAEGETLLGLGKLDGTLGFYAVDGTIGANKAYLRSTTGAQAIKISFNGQYTNIDNAVTIGSSNAPIYDITGRRVANMKHAGVYIKNGKKVIIK